MKNDLEFFILKFTEPLQRYLLGQFSLSGEICLHWAAATLKGLGEFQKKGVDHFLLLFLGKKCQFQNSRF